MTDDEREMLLEMPAAMELVREAVAAEREACAQVAESRESHAAIEVAAAIRARGEGG